jgi:hypothetical protein
MNPIHEEKVMPTPRISPASTSEGKWTPRKTRSSPTTAATETATATATFRHAEDSSGHSRKTSTDVTTAMLVACPDGNE